MWTDAVPLRFSPLPYTRNVVRNGPMWTLKQANSIKWQYQICRPMVLLSHDLDRIPDACPIGDGELRAGKTSFKLAIKKFENSMSAAELRCGCLTLESQFGAASKRGDSSLIWSRFNFRTLREYLIHSEMVTNPERNVQILLKNY